MDPLDEYDSFKYITKGAPVKVENILNYDVKEILKSPYFWGTLAAGAGLAYYYIFGQEDEDSNNPNNPFDSFNNGSHNHNHNHSHNQNHNHSHNQNHFNHHNNNGYSQTPTHTTTTTTTTTTTSSSMLPPSSSIPPPKLKNKNGDPLSIEEQNLLLLKENSSLRNENRDLQIWVSNQINCISDRMEKMQIDLDRERYCHICEENEKQVCWKECGHRLCGRCATLIKKSSSPQCSICRIPVSEFFMAWNT